MRSPASSSAALPLTSAELQGPGWIGFEKYSLVGANSGPNQFALYTGQQLHGRNLTSGPNSATMLWTRLKEEGYVTLKIEDDCILNSNMMQSLMPEVDHGNQLKDLFCRETSMPHCVGGVPAAQHALDYATDFVNLPGYRGVPKAAFVHLTDGHEDTLTMIRSVDAQIAKFVKRHAENATGRVRGTTLVVLSDHGLHYGSYFSTPSGQIEHQSPLLYIKPHGRTPRNWVSAMRENARVQLVTPFDLHETILTAVRANLADRTSVIGSSLYLPVPDRTCNQAGIPSEYCPGAPTNVVTRNKLCPQVCTPLSQVPSLDSYYAAQLAIENRTAVLSEEVDHIGQNPEESRPITDASLSSKTGNGPGTRHRGLVKIVTDGAVRFAQIAFREALAFNCKCFVSRKVLVRDFGQASTWMDCDEPTSNVSKPRGLELRPHDDFAVVTCSKNTTDGGVIAIYDHAVDVVVNYSPRAHTSGTDQPNVLVLELDSVAAPMFERRFPKLKALFDGKNSICEASVAVESALFPVQSALGPNSLPNQVALLSGCVPVSNSASHSHDDARRLAKAGWTRVKEHWNLRENPREVRCVTRFGNMSGRAATGYTIMCPPGVALPFRTSRVSNGTILKDGSIPSAWLFDLATDAGYSTSFAEDVCYHFSGRCDRRWSTQDMFFDTKVGYHHHDFSSAFCALKWARNRPDGDPMDHRVRYELLLEYISKTFAVAPSTPKFALVNFGAGHDYRSLPYRHNHIQMMDGKLTAMLCGLLSNPAGANTVVVLWSDHGLQDGPAGLDWVSQAEQRNPVLGFLAPPKLVGPAFRQNRHRLVTAHDVYRTISRLLKPRAKMVPATHPVWAYDLLQDTVPADRTCAAALVPPDYCVCSHEYTGTDGVPLPPEAGQFATDYGLAREKASKGKGDPRWSGCSALQPSLRGMCAHEDPKRLAGCCFRGLNQPLVGALREVRNVAHAADEDDMHVH